MSGIGQSREILPEEQYVARLRSHRRDAEANVGEEEAGGEEAGGEVPQEAGGEEAGGEVPQEAGGEVPAETYMETLRDYLVAQGLEEKVLDEVCIFLQTKRLPFLAFAQYVSYFLVSRGHTEPLAAAKSIEAFQIYTGVSVSRQGKEGPHQSVSSALSNLSLSGSRASSSSSSGPPFVRPPLIFQDKGLEGLHSSLIQECFPEPARSDDAKALWPSKLWKSSMSIEGKYEKKFVKLLAEMRQTHMQREDVNFVFIKGTMSVCRPKIPDFFLVNKDYPYPPTPETVGALLFAQSTTEETNSYSSYTAVGEAIACGQLLLRNASTQRSFVFVGVTNLHAIKWIKVQRPGVAGEFCGCQDVETPRVRHNLAGYMLCSPDNLGLFAVSISTRMGSIRLGRWLGEGATSNVFNVCIEKNHYAVKVAKEGHSLSSDIEFLSKLENIYGVPSIFSAYSDPRAVFMTPVCQHIDIRLLERKKLRQFLANLVDTLQAVHGRLVVNRDVRMQNIMIDTDGFFIVDWGYAALVREDVAFAGTTWFASDRALRYLEEGLEEFALDGSDDLVSLVRSLYVLSRLTSDVQTALENIGKHDFASIRRFWLEEFRDSKAWSKLEELATEGKYDDLKNWLKMDGSSF